MVKWHHWTLSGFILATARLRVVAPAYSSERTSASILSLLTNSFDVPAYGVVDREKPSVYAVLCHDNPRDPHLQFVTARMESLGYKVVLPDCSKVFTDQFVSNRTGQRYNLWGRRLAAYQKVVQELTPLARVLLLDVKDVLVMANVTETVDKFVNFKAPLVASCTEAMWPPPEDCPAYLNVRSPYTGVSSCKFPCAGALMGTAFALQRLLDGVQSSDEHISDQCWLHQRLAMLRKEDDFALDLDGNLFLDVNRVPIGKLQPRRGRYQILSSEPGAGTALEPAFLHMPGMHPTAQAVEELYAMAKRSRLDTVMT